MRPIIEALSAGFFILFINVVILSHHEAAAAFASLFTLCVCTIAICELTREPSK